MNMDNRLNIKNGKDTCNHNYRDMTNTLLGVPKFKMVYPNMYYLKCQICGEVMSINRNEISDVKEFIHTFF